MINRDLHEDTPRNEGDSESSWKGTKKHTFEESCYERKEEKMALYPTKLSGNLERNLRREKGKGGVKSQ